MHILLWNPHQVLPRKLLYGVKQFNLEPSRGLKYLQESAFVTTDPESVAKFLFCQERLSKKQIGEWNILGKPHRKSCTFIWALPKKRLPPPPHSNGHSGAPYFPADLRKCHLNFNFPSERCFFTFFLELNFPYCAGKYLGSHVEFNQEVLGHFVRCHQFEQLLLVQALRQFLWSFRWSFLQMWFGKPSSVLVRLWYDLVCLA